MEDPIKPLQKYIDLYNKYKNSKDDIEHYRLDFNENPRTSLAIASAIIGGIESRTKDEEIKRWAVWGVLETLKTFNSFPRLSDNQLSYLFFVLGRHFIPVLLHDKGVKSDAFKSLNTQDQIKAVQDVLDINFENVVIRCLQAIDFLHIE